MRAEGLPEPAVCRSSSDVSKAGEEADESSEADETPSYFSLEPSTAGADPLGLLQAVAPRISTWQAHPGQGPVRPERRSLGRSCAPKYVIYFKKL